MTHPVLTDAFLHPGGLAGTGCRGVLQDNYQPAKVIGWLCAEIGWPTRWRLGVRRLGTGLRSGAHRPAAATHLIEGDNA